MLVILTSLIALASGPATDAPKPDAPAAVAKPAKAKPEQTCVVTKKGKLFGHEVTHTKCEDAKPKPLPAPAA